jgi:hypothetical protein
LPDINVRSPDRQEGIEAMANDNRQEIQGSIVVCESLDVREDLNVGGGLTVGGVPVGGGGIGGVGTPDALARFTAPDTIGDAGMTDNGSVIGIQRAVNWGPGEGGGATNGVITPAALPVGTTADYSPAGLASANTLRQALAGNAALSGIDVSVFGTPAEADGVTLLIMNLSTLFQLTLANSGGGVANNQFATPNLQPFVISAQGAVFVRYDGGPAGGGQVNRWKVLARL